MQRATAGVDEYDSAEVNPWDLRLVEILRLVAKVVQSNPTFAIIRLERYLIERAKVITEIVTEALASSNLSRVNEYVALSYHMCERDAAGVFHFCQLLFQALESSQLLTLSI